MDEIWAIFTSWQFLLVGGVVFLIMSFFNGLGSWKGLGHYLWATKKRPVRRFLKFMEAVKVLFLPLTGFTLGWVPGMPRPSQLEEASTLSLAMLYSVSGLCSMLIVKFLKKTAEARGIDIDIDLDPREQKRKRNCDDSPEHDSRILR